MFRGQFDLRHYGDEPSREDAATGPKTGEAWWISDLNVTSVIQLMNLIHESEETAEPMS